MSLTKAVKEEAAVIYRKALEKDMVRGRSIDVMVAAALHGESETENRKKPR